MSLELAQWADTVEEIRNLHQGILCQARTSLSNAIRIGELLTLSKGGLKHGEWLPWVEKNLPFSNMTVSRYVRIYEMRDDPRLNNVLNLSDAYSKALISSGNDNGNGNGVAQLHESNFYSRSIRLTQSLMGEINHELKDHPLETWGRDKWISVAAATEPVAELHQRIKALLT